MPQLDLLILFTQYKAFIFLFFSIYLIILYSFLPKLNLNLRIRKFKLKNLSFTSNMFKVIRFFLFHKVKDSFLVNSSEFEHFFTNSVIASKNNLNINFLTLLKFSNISEK